jgi:CRP/FNR family transcriptional regulator
MVKRTALDFAYPSSIPAALNLLPARICRRLFQAVEGIGRSQLLPRGSVLFLQGQKPAGVFLVRSGRVKLFVAGKGRQLLLRIAEPGEMLGLSASISGRPHEYTAQTTAPCDVVFVRRKDLSRFLRHDPEACLQIAELLSRKVATAYKRVGNVRLSACCEPRHIGR